MLYATAVWNASDLPRPWRINNRQELALNKFAQILIALTAYAASVTARADEYAIHANVASGALSVDATLHRVSTNEKICLPAFGQRFGEQFAVDAFKMTEDGRPYVKNSTVAIDGANEKPPSNDLPAIDNSGCFIAKRDGTYAIRYRLTMARLPDGRYWFASKLSPHAADDFMAFPGESLFIERNVGAHSKGNSTTTVVVSGAPVHSTLLSADVTETSSRLNNALSTQSTSANVATTPPTSNAFQYQPNAIWSNERIDSFALQRKADDVRTSDPRQLPTHGMTTRLPPKNSKFIAPNAHTLTRSFWTFGSPRSLEIQTNDTALTLVYDSAVAPFAQILQRDAARIWTYYAKVIPTKAPQHVTVFAFHARFDARYHHGFARPNGIVVQLGRKSAAHPAQRRILIAHELFHLFNGENLLFAPSEYEKTSWFREGMTQYIAIQTLRKLSLIDDSQIAAWITDAYRRNASKTSPGDDFAYYYGYLVSLAIEQQWRLRQTSLSLLGFWQWLSSTDKWSLLYDNDMLRASLNQYSAFNFDDFFRRYVDDTRQLPASAILRQDNLCVYKSKELRYSAGLIYAVDANSASLVVQKSLPQSPAAQANLAPGDIVAPADDTDWTAPTDKILRLYRAKIPTTIRLPAHSYTFDTETIAPCANSIY